jgi:hypothetical protein
MVKTVKGKEQVFYNNKFVDKDTFCAFVYSKTKQKLAKTHQEFEKLIATGLWFIDKAAVDADEKSKKKAKKLKESEIKDELQPAVDNESLIEKAKESLDEADFSDKRK